MEASLQKISDNVHWLPPGPPDRPSLCAVAGSRNVLMLDAGSSAAHARLFLEALADAGVAPPRYVALTHWHWDHVFGAAELGALVVAHAATVEKLADLATYEWSDDALDERLAAGAVPPSHVANIKEELPAPREVRIAPVDVVLRGDALDFELGSTTVRLEHVGGDHATDSCVLFVEPDGVLFLGDCLYEATDDPDSYLTRRETFRLLDQILGFDAELYVEGHNDVVMRRAEVEALAGKTRLAGELVERLRGSGTELDEATVLAAARKETREVPDEHTTDLVRAFLAGRDHEGRV